MADTELNVVNRPAVVTSAIEAVVRGWPVIAAALSFGLWLVHLEGKTDTAGTDIVSLRAGITESNVRWEAAAKAQGERVDRIVGDRVTDVQRLATVEEAVKGQGSILRDISAKLDRALVGRLGR